MSVDHTVDSIKVVGVIGSGAMGNQISELLVRIGGYRVNMMDISPDLVSKGLSSIDNRVEKFFVAKGKMTSEDKKNLLGHIKGVTEIKEAVKDADFVIEAAIENLAQKKEIFKKMDEHSMPHAILVSNTSYLNITEMASATKKPDKVAGMHFFNPVAMMKLVEVVRCAQTSDATADTVRSLALKLEKEPVVCRDSSFGFLANRAYRVLIDEAVQMVWERAGTPEDIDKALRLGYNLPQGPLQVADMAGSWGRRVSSEEDSIKELGDVKGRVHPLVRMMVRSGYIGGAGNKGLYDFYKDVLSKW